jgi:hypothetical protein
MFTDNTCSKEYYMPDDLEERIGKEIQRAADISYNNEARLWAQLRRLETRVAELEAKAAQPTI